MSAVEVRSGELNESHIGKVIDVQTKSGAQIADVLISIVHWSVMGLDDQLAGDPRTLAKFVHIRPASTLGYVSPMQSDGFFELDVDELATIRSAFL